MLGSGAKYLIPSYLCVPDLGGEVNRDPLLKSSSLLGFPSQPSMFKIGHTKDTQVIWQQLQNQSAIRFTNTTKRLQKTILSDISLKRFPQGWLFSWLPPLRVGIMYPENLSRSFCVLTGYSTLPGYFQRPSKATLENEHKMDISKVSPLLFCKAKGNKNFLSIRAPLPPHSLPTGSDCHPFISRNFAPTHFPRLIPIQLHW